MRRRPLIGVPTQTLQAIDDIPEGLPHSWVMNRRYFIALTSVGAAPVMLPLLDDDPTTMREIFERLDGLFLAGGVDLDPASYGSEREEHCGRTDEARDTVEIEVARWAIERGMPVLGVCRGMQILNVVYGGSLHQDCAACLPDSIKHDYFPTAGFARDYLAHEVRLGPGSRLERAFGASSILVNSMHHQGVSRIGQGLVASAHAEDGLIEAIESEDGAFAVGVQWHPEMLIDADEGTRRLFEWFVDEAHAYSTRSATVRLQAPGAA
jgi:putative glutamine amidotransferase